MNTAAQFLNSGRDISHDIERTPSEQNYIQLLNSKEKTILNLRVQLVKQAEELAELRNQQCAVQKIQRFLDAQIPRLQGIADGRGLDSLKGGGALEQRGLVMATRNSARVALALLSEVAKYLELT